MKQLVVAALMLCLSPVSSQQLLDRVVARVNGIAITQSDVSAALALGVISGADGADDGATVEQLIRRQLVLAEVARFAPPEPDPALVDREIAAMKMRAGARLSQVMQSTGIDETRIRDLARDTLRIQAYLNQRFGTTVQVSDEEVRQYYRAHPAEFARNGSPIPFEEAEADARQRAAAARRNATIDQWMMDLRGRADVTIPSRRPAAPPVN
jgi:hypothetical protein